MQPLSEEYEIPDDEADSSYAFGPGQYFAAELTREEANEIWGRMSALGPADQPSYAYPNASPSVAPVTAEIRAESFIQSPVLSADTVAARVAFCEQLFGTEAVKSSRSNEVVCVRSRLSDLCLRLPEWAQVRLKMLPTKESLRRWHHLQRAISLFISPPAMFVAEFGTPIGIEGKRTDGTTHNEDYDLYCMKGTVGVNVDISAHFKHVPNGKLARIPPYAGVPEGFEPKADSLEEAAVHAITNQVQALGQQQVDALYDDVTSRLAKHYKTVASSVRSKQLTVPAGLVAVASVNDPTNDQVVYSALPPDLKAAASKFFTTACLNKSTRLLHAPGVLITNDTEFHPEEWPESISRIVKALDGQDQEFKKVADSVVFIPHAPFHENLSDAWGRVAFSKKNTKTPPTVDSDPLIHHVDASEGRSHIGASDLFEEGQEEISMMLQSAELPAIATQDIASALDGVVHDQSRVMCANILSAVRASLSSVAGVELFLRFQVMNTILLKYRYHKPGWMVSPIHGFKAVLLVKSSGPLEKVHALEYQLFYRTKDETRSYGGVMQVHMMRSWMLLYYRTIAGLAAYVDSCIGNIGTLGKKLIMNMRGLILISLVNTNFLAKTLENVRYMFSSGFATEASLASMAKKLLDYPAGSHIEVMLLWRALKFGLCLRACCQEKMEQIHPVALPFEVQGIPNLEHLVNFSYACNFFIKQLEHSDDHTLINTFNIATERKMFLDALAVRKLSVYGVHAAVGATIAAEIDAEIADIEAFTPAEDDRGEDRHFHNHLAIALLAVRKYTAQVDHSTFMEASCSSCEQIVNSRGACSSKDPSRKTTSAVEFAETVGTFIPGSHLNLDSIQPEASEYSLPTLPLAMHLLSMGAPVELILKNKPNQRGNRDIWGLTAAARVLCLSLENFARELKKADPVDKLDKADKWTELMAANKEAHKRSKADNDLIITKESDDCSRFGPTMIPLVMIEYLRVCTRDAESSAVIVELQHAYHRKQVFLPPRLDTLLEHEWNPGSRSAVKADLIRSVFGKDKSFPSPSNMPMGILHSTTSFLHAMAQHLVSDIFTKLGVEWTKCFVTADDSVRLSVHVPRITRAFLQYVTDSTMRTFNIAINLAKRTASGLFLEFNSIYIKGELPMSISLKVALGAISPGIGESELEDRMLALSAGASVLSQSGTYVLSCFTTAVRLAFHLTQWGWWGEQFGIPAELGGRSYIEPINTIISGPESASLIKLTPAMFETLTSFLARFDELVVTTEARQFPGSTEPPENLVVVRTISSVGTIATSRWSRKRNTIGKRPACRWEVATDFFDPRRGSTSANRLLTVYSMGGSEALGAFSDVDIMSRMAYSRCYSDKPVFVLAEGHPLKEDYPKKISFDTWKTEVANRCQRMLPRAADLETAMGRRLSALHEQVDAIVAHVSSFQAPVRTLASVQEVFVWGEIQPIRPTEVLMSILDRFLNDADRAKLSSRLILPSTPPSGKGAKLSLQEALTLHQSVTSGWAHLFRAGTTMILRSNTSRTDKTSLASLIMHKSWCGRTGLCESPITIEPGDITVQAQLMTIISSSNVVRSDTAITHHMAALTSRSAATGVTGLASDHSRDDPIAFANSLCTRAAPAFVYPSIQPVVKGFTLIPRAASGWAGTRISRGDRDKNPGYISGCLLVQRLRKPGYAIVTFDDRQRPVSPDDVVVRLPAKAYGVVSFQGYNCMATAQGLIPIAPINVREGAHDVPEIPIPDIKPAVIGRCARPTYTREEVAEQVRNPCIPRRGMIDLIPSAIAESQNVWLNLGGLHAPWAEFLMKEATFRAVSGISSSPKEISDGPEDALFVAEDYEALMRNLAAAPPPTEEDDEAYFAGVLELEKEYQAAQEVPQPPDDIDLGAVMETLTNVMRLPLKRAKFEGFTPGRIERGGMAPAVLKAFRQKCATLVIRIAKKMGLPVRSIEMCLRYELPEHCIASAPDYAWETIFWNAMIAERIDGYRVPVSVPMA